MLTADRPSYLHSLDTDGVALPEAFTYPFRYTPHPLCLRAARLVQEYLDAEGLSVEGKMYGVLVVEGGFLAAYSGQLNGSYAHPWFVPPVFDYLSPECFFQKEQAEIVSLTKNIENTGFQEHIDILNNRLRSLVGQREEAVEKAKMAYERGKKNRGERRAALDDSSPEARPVMLQLERESQFQKAEIKRAKQLHAEEVNAIEAHLADLQATLRRAREERRQRSEALQDWLFRQFIVANGSGERISLADMFDGKPPSGAGECCGPKLLNAAFASGLRPLAMAEFWWGPPLAGNYRRQGVFYPACNSKCKPILSFMLKGLAVAPDPARHYERLGGDVEVVWEDAWMAVVAKPTGWLSVAGKSPLPDVCQWARGHWPGIAGPVVVHRLDQDTSGLMILAKTQMSYSWLQKMFEGRNVRKRYVALLEGHWQRAEQSGTISLPLVADYDYLPRQRVDREHGKQAVTQYEVIGNEGLHEEAAGEVRERAVTRIAFYPLTGRTHQLRLHAASPEGLGMSIVGDRLYGLLSRRLYLHAEALDFVHPVTGEALHFEVPAIF